MRYTYHTYTKGRIGPDVSTRFDHIPTGQDITRIEVFDNTLPRKAEPIRVLVTDEDMLGWRTSLEMATAWKPPESPTKVVYNALEETDGFHVKDSPVDRNVKTAAAINKPRMSPVPPIALIALGTAMQDGANKYGRFNWRETDVTSSVFFDAMLRHLIDWYSGEDFAQDSKIHHLAHLMAGAAIILDAEVHGVLRDDRDKTHLADITMYLNIVKE